jgi:hypothetical protein
MIRLYHTARFFALATATLLFLSSLCFVNVVGNEVRYTLENPGGQGKNTQISSSTDLHDYCGFIIDFFEKEGREEEQKESDFEKDNIENDKFSYNHSTHISLRFLGAFSYVANTQVIRSSRQYLLYGQLKIDFSATMKSIV